MKIAMISRMVSLVGGVQACVWELSKRFAEKGHEVHLYTNSCPDLPHPSVAVHRVPMLMSRSFFSSQNPWVKALQIWSFGWISRFVISRRDYDIIHVHGDSMVKADLRTAHSCHKAWIKYELLQNSSFGSVLKKRLNPLHSIVLLIEYYDYTLKGAQHAISESGSVKQQMIDNYKINAARISVVPTGVEGAKYAIPDDFDREGFRRTVGVPVSAPLMVFVGWEFGRKGLSTVFEAMIRMKSRQPHLLVVGDDYRMSQFVKQAESLGIDDQVHFVGAQSDFRPFLWGSDLFVFPTRYDPCPLVIPEAMAAGLPVITTETAGNSEWLEDGKDAVLMKNPYDAKELSESLDRLFGNPQLIQAMGQAAQQKAGIFEWDRVAEMTLDVYESVTESKRN